MMKQLILFFLLTFFLSVFSFAQRPSRPEKCWAFTHPFVAKKAYRITKLVQQDVDSVRRSLILGTDMNGGKLDAFKHAYWMASLYVAIGKNKALKLGVAHEKGNYLEYKNGKPEDAILPDSVSSEMDLKNNIAGIESLGNCRTFRTRKDLQSKVLHAVNTGKMYVIKKDENGNYLDCAGNVIDMGLWKGKWGIPKCLIASL